METWTFVTVVVSGVNLVLLGALSYIWISNYTKFRSPHILGLVIFAVALSAENLAAIYFYFSMEMLYATSPTAQRVVVFLRGLQLVALLALTWTTAK
ncbi:hypothetical protein EGH25_09055 [Haladaptatus sp. F3-133]|uniref:Uncharacterized protein n=1 Tax=Halorutilus salinus TaxID=2487751 RepID=A0A9Q4C747_9EURY|nr:hypothetical protein [Halorutilus salinus]MCX2819496.1 hypothetical protein [Halorutilus salinus]